MPYLRELAGDGVDRFVVRSPGHAASLKLRDGQLTNPAVAVVFRDLPKA